MSINASFEVGESSEAKMVYVSAENMAQALAKVKNSGVVELTPCIGISEIQIKDILEPSKEESMIYSVQYTNGDQCIFPVKDISDIESKIMDRDVETVGLYTDKGYLIK